MNKYEDGIIPYDHRYEGEFGHDPGWDNKENKRFRVWMDSLSPKVQKGDYQLMCFNEHGAYEAWRQKTILESMGWHFRDKLPPVMYAQSANKRGLMYARRLDYCWPVAGEE